MGFDPGTYRERFIILTPPGGGATDDRDSDGWVDPHAVVATPTDGATIHCAERELTFEEKVDGGLDMAEGYYQLRTWPRSGLTSKLMLRRKRDDLTMEIVYAPDYNPDNLEAVLLCRRVKE